MMKKITYKKLGKTTASFVFVALFIALGAQTASAAAEFAVNSFSCTPAEVVINNDFSCTAQIINNGDTAGSVSVATLYPDENAWLEDSSYAQSSGTSVDPGQTTEVTFSGLRATKSGGSNGFSKITLDSVTDTSGVDGVTVNVIDVVVTVSNTASSRAAGETFDATTEVTAGGNIDVTLSWAADSGGCSIGNQASSKTISGMGDNDRDSRSWTVTMGTSGNCRYTITASARGSAGAATKSDSSSSTVTCSSGCTSVSSSSSSSSGGGGGGGGGGVGKLIKEIGELKTSVQEEIGNGEYIAFTFGNVNHSISITNLTETTATIIVRSLEHKFTLTVGEERKIDFEGDGKDDITIRLQSINLISKKALLIVTPLYVPGSITKAGAGDEGKEKEKAGERGGGIASDIGKALGNNYLWLVGIAIGILIILIGIVILKRYGKTEKIRKAVRVKHFTVHK